MAEDNLTRLNTDLLSQILARLDGPALASAASASSDLRAVVEEDDLWKHLSHATWPSTQDTTAQNLISSLGGFSNFYARSFPFILYNPPEKLPSLFQESAVPKTPLSPSDFASFVDVHFRGQCIFSKVLNGIQGADAVSGCDVWFLDCPFRLDLLQSSRDLDGHDYVDGYDDDETATIAIAPSVEKNGRGVEKLCKELEEEVRLSWVLLDTRSGKAVNLSSQKPVLVQRHWASKDDILMRFGCVVPPEDGVEPTECVISARVQFDRGEGCLKLREINMQLENKDGVHISGRRSLMVLEKALRCCRSRKWSEFDKGYGEYVKEKREMREKKMKIEGVVDNLCAFTGSVVFAAWCYFFLLSVS